MFREMGKLWQIGIYEEPITILIMQLLHRIVYTDRVDPHRTRLHLELHIVDPWLIVSENPSKPVGKSPLPWLHTSTSDERYECRSRAEVDPSDRLELPHDTIDKRYSRPSILDS